MSQAQNTSDCTSISPECPVSATIYGYTPNLGGNAFFTAWFAVLLIGQLILGPWKRIWSFTAWVSIGVFLELLGYIGRLLLNNNPWSIAGFEIQICCLVLAPSFMAAGVYLSFKHIVNYVGPEYSRLRPNWYPWIFICCDAVSILTQALGGGIAASAGTGSNPNQGTVNAGDDLIVFGIAFQVFTMTVCGCLSLDFFLRLRKGRLSDSSDDSNTYYPKFRYYCYAIVFAYFTILIRCIYRIPEMAGGWGNPRMREEATFLILDGLMIALAATALTVAHPGIMFPAWSKAGERREIQIMRGSDSLEAVEVSVFKRRKHTNRMHANRVLYRRGRSNPVYERFQNDLDQETVGISGQLVTVQKDQIRWEELRDFMAILSLVSTLERLSMLE